MGKRLNNLPPLGQVIADEVTCLGISVRNLCANGTLQQGQLLCPYKRGSRSIDIHIRLLRCMREYHTAQESREFEQRYLDALIGEET